MYTQEIILEAQRFYQFISEVILPFESSHFKKFSKFHHQLIYTACTSLSATAAPRDHLKSTIFAKYRPLHKLLDPPKTQNKQTDILIVSETSTLSQQHLSWIKWHIENNPQIRIRYGNQVPKDSDQKAWNQDEIELNNRNKCRAVGAAAQIRGRHPTDIIVDDIESPKNMDTPEKLAKLKDWFFRALMGAMEPDTSLHVVGTIIDRASLLTELLANKEFNGKLWKSLIEDPVTKKYEALWPEQWSVETLLKRKALVGTHRFEAEYQNNPIGLLDPIVYRSWIKEHSDHHLMATKPIKRYITVDPAFTEERWGNYSAIMVLDYCEDGMLYERFSIRKKVTGPELIRTIMRVYEAYSKGVETRLGVEEVQAQKMIRQAIYEIDPSITVIPLKPDADKKRRLISVSRFFEYGIVSLMTQSLIDEVLAAPHCEMDRVDTLVYALKLHEQEYPVIRGGQFCNVDSLKSIGDTELQYYMERYDEDIPSYLPSPDLVSRYDDAQDITDMIEGID